MYRSSGTPLVFLLHLHTRKLAWYEHIVGVSDFCAAATQNPKISTMSNTAKSGVTAFSTLAAIFATMFPD